MKLIFSLLVCLAGNQLYAQSRVSDYLGTWRWTSGTDDTLVLIIKSVTPTGKLKKSPYFDPAKTLFMAFHTYIQKGALVESDANLVSDTLTEHTYISGVLNTSPLRLTIKDYTRNIYYSGELRIIDGDSKTAVLHLPETQEKWVLAPERLFPTRRTLPHNIVLEKIL